MNPASTFKERAARHAALSDPVRLQIVDELSTSDRAPNELLRLTGIASNLMAHHLDVLERAGLIERSRSSGDGRRRYVRLRRESLVGLSVPRSPKPGRALFVCSANSARSQMAAALWHQTTGESATSAGTHPADQVHPQAVAAAHRAGIDIGEAVPRNIAAIGPLPPLMITVCDRAHEEIEADELWVHWSIQDPVAAGTDAAFDAALQEIRERIKAYVATGINPHEPMPS